MERDQLTLEFRRIMGILRRGLLLILAASICCGALMWVFSDVVMKPEYTASVTMYIYSNTNRNPDNSEITSSELSASQLLVDTYIVILQSDTVLDKVVANLGLKATTDTLRQQISASAVNDTEVLEVSVTDQSPTMAQAIANEIAAVLPEELIRVVKAGGVEVIDYAKTPKEPSAPNVMLFIMAGLLTGFLVSCAVLVLADYFSVKIKSEETLEMYFDIPVLGMIPKLDTGKENDHEEK